MREAPAPEERKLATVLFADLVGSTALGSEQDPERTRALLERFYDAMAAEIESAGGTVEKFVGDAVMAAFGAPVAQEDHAERALHAALSMQRRLAELFGDELALRIGVNTGEVVTGRAREGSSFVSGDAVNVAARLEQAAGPGEVLAGERTVASARGAFEFEEPRAVEAKGKEGGVRGRRLMRALSLMRPRGVSGLRQAFVGREPELDLLLEAYGRARDERRPYLVTVLGDAGVGKTRLVRELWDRLGKETPEPLRRTGRCLHYGQGITYWPLGEILKEHFGVLETDSPETLLGRLGDRRVLALTLGLDVAGDLHPLVARDRLHEAWAAFLAELAAQRPTVVLVEDLHWAEPDFLDLLELLLRAVDGSLLLVATARPELLDRRPGWGGARRAATTVELEPLSPADAGLLLAELLATELPGELANAVLHRAEGNPFFVEELLGTLIDRGVLERGNGGWTAGGLPAEFSIPDSVQAVVAARIDLLPDAEKAALQAASVIGRAFWPGPVYELVGDAAPDLRVLEERDFVRRRSGSSIAGETEYVFKHQVTREVAYGSLPKAKRARLHAGFATWLERFGEGRDEHAPFLAHHYAEATRPEDADLAWADAPAELERLTAKAVGWLARAGELAVTRYEIQEGLTLLQRALALQPVAEVKIGVLRRIAAAHLARYDMERFRAALEEALALEPGRGAAADIYAELAHYGRGRTYMWKQPPPPELGERWLTEALELAEPGTRARAQALVARALASPEAGGAEAAEALALAEELGDPTLLLNAYEAEALVATASGRFRKAYEWSARAVEAAPMLSDPDLRAHAYWNAGFASLRVGRLAEAPAHAGEFERVGGQLTPHHEVHAVALRLLHSSALGHWHEVQGMVERAGSASRANKETPCQFNWRNLLVCALALGQLGEERESRRLEDAARAEAVVAGPPEREAALLRLALLRGNLEEVERILALLPREVDPFGVDADAARLDALVALGDRDAVEEGAAPFLEEQGYTQPFALRALGVARGDRRLLAEAVSRFEAIGLAFRADETRSLSEGLGGRGPTRL